MVVKAAKCTTSQLSEELLRNWNLRLTERHLLGDVLQQRDAEKGSHEVIGFPDGKQEMIQRTAASDPALPSNRSRALE